MNAVAIIPARYGSTRFPGKPLARETGKFLIQHVYERASAARLVQRCLVATDDARIADAVRSFGGEAVLTRSDHASGTDRIAEVVRNMARSGHNIVVKPAGGFDFVLNVQGDEPEIEPAYLDRLIERLSAEHDCPVATLACPFPEGADPRDPDCVKVVRNRLGRALYFSRALIPFLRDGTEAASEADWLLHLGVYAYRTDFLLEMAGWSPTPLERTEKLEQLRILENGRQIAVELVQRATVGIDTPADYEQFVARWQAAGGARVA
jgi:3-deoxy-manno-octulosonate cytidylyltransferase (CMP-KDO synthetase)